MVMNIGYTIFWAHQFSYRKVDCVINDFQCLVVCMNECMIGCNAAFGVQLNMRFN